MAHSRIGAGNTGGSLYSNGSLAVVAGDQVFLQGCTGRARDGREFVGQGDPAAQAEGAMQSVRQLLEEAGGRMEDICMVTNYTTQHSSRDQVYPVIARHLAGVNPVSTGLVVKSLAEPCIDFQIDAWAVLPRDRETGHERFRLTNARGGFLMPSLDFGNAKIVRANDHLFLQGQTGMTLDGRDFVGSGDPAKQAEAAMENVRELLADTGADLDDICKVTIYITDPSYRQIVYPVVARYLRDVQPVSTGVVVKELARPELDLEIDVFAMVSDAAQGRHERHGVTAANYLPGLDFPLSKAVRAGNFVFLQGQTGLALDGSGLVGRGDPAAQAEQAMQSVKILLEQTGACMEDIAKVTTYVTEREALASVSPVLGRHLRGVDPTSTTVVMEALADPELDVVIDVFAAIPATSDPGSIGPNE